MAQPLTWKPIPMPSNATASRMASAANRSLFQAGSLLSSGFADLTASNKVAKDQAKNPELDFATEQITALNKTDQFTEENRKRLLGQLKNADARREANKVWEKEKASTLGEEKAATEFTRAGEKHELDLASTIQEIEKSKMDAVSTRIQANAQAQSAATGANRLQHEKNIYEEGKKQLTDVTGLIGGALSHVRKTGDITGAIDLLETRAINQGMTPEQLSLARKGLKDSLAMDPQQQQEQQIQKEGINKFYEQLSSAQKTKVEEAKALITPLPAITSEELNASILKQAGVGGTGTWDNQNEEYVAEAMKHMPAAKQFTRENIQAGIESAITSPEQLQAILGLGTPVNPENFAQLRTTFAQEKSSGEFADGYINALLQSEILSADSTESEPLETGSRWGYYGSLDRAGQNVGRLMVQNLSAERDATNASKELLSIANEKSQAQRLADVETLKATVQGRTIPSWASAVNTIEKRKEKARNAMSETIGLPEALPLIFKQGKGKGDS